MSTFETLKARLAASRNARQPLIRGAVRGVVASAWDLADKLNGDFGRPTTLTETIQRAITATREVLQSVGEFPMPPDIQYKGVKVLKEAAGGTERVPLIGEGTLILHAQFMTKSGMKDSFDIPVQVRAGKVIQPSVLLHDGSIRILAPSTIRELVTKGTFSQAIPARPQFAAPLSREDMRARSVAPAESRVMERINPGMYSVHGARELIRAAMRGEAAFKVATEGRWCEKCKVHHRDTTQCPYAQEQKKPSEQQKEPSGMQDKLQALFPGKSRVKPETFDLLSNKLSGEGWKATPEQIINEIAATQGKGQQDAIQLLDFLSDSSIGAIHYDRSTGTLRAGKPRTAQLGSQPARGSLSMTAGPASRVGDRVVTKVEWDPDKLVSMSDGNIHNAIRSLIVELGSKKEWRDWGTVADVQIDGFDRSKGVANVSFKTSETASPQLSAADLEDIPRLAAINPTQQETDLDPAERDRDGFHVGDTVKLMKGQIVRNRGGGTEVIPKGEEGVVVADMAGEGQSLKVLFEKFSPAPLPIPAEHVRRASFCDKVFKEIEGLRRAGYSPVDAIITARQRYGSAGEEALKAAKEKGLLDW